MKKILQLIISVSICLSFLPTCFGNKKLDDEWMAWGARLPSERLCQEHFDNVIDKLPTSDGWYVSDHHWFTTDKVTRYLLKHCKETTQSFGGKRAEKKARNSWRKWLNSATEEQSDCYREIFDAHSANWFHHHHFGGSTYIIKVCGKAGELPLDLYY